MKLRWLALAAPLLVAAAPPIPREAASQVSAADMHNIVETLVSFGTRHTLSSQTDPKRGIGAAQRWAGQEFTRISLLCGGCLKIERPSATETGERIPKPTEVMDVLAVQRGTSDPNRVVIISGHLDSRVSDPLDATKDAPGANDDGSGTAAVIEAARLLSKRQFPATIVYAVLTGEEQGLYGGKILANYAKAQGWQVEAVLNNDIIGNSCGSDGKCDADHVRIFSEGPRWQGHEDLAARIRSLGGENDSPSRNLSRWLDGLADDLKLGLDVRPIWRNDRFSRGGDHSELLNAGYPAVRVTVAIENYNWQHQDVRIENGVQYGDTIDKMDFPYLAKVTSLNVAALAGLALAPMPPEPKVEGAVSTDTIIRWNTVTSAKGYVVRWRRTDESRWSQEFRISDANAEINKGGESCHLSANEPPIEYCLVKLMGIRIDDWVFGVSSVSADGYESPVASAVPGGAFKPYVPPQPK